MYQYRLESAKVTLYDTIIHPKVWMPVSIKYTKQLLYMEGHKRSPFS